MKKFHQYIKEQQQMLPNTRGQSGSTNVQVARGLHGPLTQEIQLVTGNLIQHLQSAHDRAEEGNEEGVKVWLDQFYKYLPNLERLHDALHKAS